MPKKLQRRTVVLVVSAALFAAPAAAAALAPAPVQPSETLPAEDLGWQFVFGDRKGRLTLARGEPLHIRPLTTSGDVGAPVVPDLTTLAAAGREKLEPESISCSPSSRTTSLR